MTCFVIYKMGMEYLSTWKDYYKIKWEYKQNASA